MGINASTMGLSYAAAAAPVEGIRPIPLNRSVTYSFTSVSDHRTIVQPKVPLLHNGMSGIRLTKEEVKLLAAPFNMLLVGKFPLGIPNIFNVNKILKDLKLKSGYNVSFMDKRHVDIRVFSEDYNCLWLLENPKIEGFPMKITKWTPSFSFDTDSPIIPMWISLEKFPILLYNKEALYELAKILGKPIKVDGYTANLSKLDKANICVEMANICVEMDLSQPLPSNLWIDIDGYEVSVQVHYEDVPQFCTKCNKLGHMVSVSGQNPNNPTSKLDLNPPHVESDYLQPADLRFRPYHRSRSRTFRVGNNYVAHMGRGGGRGGRRGRGRSTFFVTRGRSVSRPAGIPLQIDGLVQGNVTGNAATVMQGEEDVGDIATGNTFAIFVDQEDTIEHCPVVPNIAQHQSPEHGPEVDTTLVLDVVTTSISLIPPVHVNHGPELNELSELPNFIPDPENEPEVDTNPGLEEVTTPVSLTPSANVIPSPEINELSELPNVIPDSQAFVSGTIAAENEFRMPLEDRLDDIFPKPTILSKNWRISTGNTTPLSSLEVLDFEEFEGPRHPNISFLCLEASKSIELLIEDYGCYNNIELENMEMRMTEENKKEKNKHKKKRKKERMTVNKIAGVTTSSAKIKRASGPVGI